MWKRLFAKWVFACESGDEEVNRELRTLAERSRGAERSLGAGSDDSRMRGLDLLLNLGPGPLQRMARHGEEVARWTRFLPGALSAVKFVELDGAGVLDPVFVDSNFRQPAVVVASGRRDGIPTDEERYPVQGPGGEVLAGDVDGDGHADLVVLESSFVGGGSGVYVLRNRGAGVGTAVAQESAGSCRRPVLEANYPNPFNAVTSIPFEVFLGAGQVRLSVHNAAGQVVRELVREASAAGHHEVSWDGTDAAGARVASGVYLCRLEVGGAIAVGRMVKLE